MLYIIFLFLCLHKITTFFLISIIYF